MSILDAHLLICYLHNMYPEVPATHVAIWKTLSNSDTSEQYAASTNPGYPIKTGPICV